MRHSNQLLTFVKTCILIEQIIICWRCNPLSALMLSCRESDTNLKHSEQRLREVVKRAPFGHRLVEVKFAPKELHPEKREYNNEEEEKQQQGGDGLHGVEQRGHQVTERCPVTGREKHKFNRATNKQMKGRSNEEEIKRQYLI